MEEPPNIHLRRFSQNPTPKKGTCRPNSGSYQSYLVVRSLGIVLSELVVSSSLQAVLLAVRDEAKALEQDFYRPEEPRTRSVRRPLRCLGRAKSLYDGRRVKKRIRRPGRTAHGAKADRGSFRYRAFVGP